MAIFLAAFDGKKMTRSDNKLDSNTPETLKAVKVIALFFAVFCHPNDYLSDIDKRC